MRRNRLRELLNEGKPTLGTHMIIPWPGVVEVIGHSGAFDYIEYVGEYSPFSLEQMDHFGRRIELFPHLSSMMKVEENGRGFIATRAIDAGIQNVLFAGVRSAGEVQECIRLVRPETPEAGGSHGCSMRRNVGYVLEAGSEGWARAMNDTVIAVMIETKTLSDDIEEVLSVPGIDMVQFGPGDFSISIGHPGEGYRNAQISDALEKSYSAAKRKGIRIRAECSVEEMPKWIEMGCRDFCVGSDTGTISAWAQSSGKAIRDNIAQAKL